ncbi:hypothetical protein ACLBV5_06990 [Brevundimonas sp. M1A4_2e]
MTSERGDPILQMGEGLDHYMKAADETAIDLLGGDDELVSALRRYDDYMRRDLLQHAVKSPGLGFVLSMNACMMFLAGARMALSGHSAAVFPLLRTALESASYAVLIERDPTLSDVWTRRHRSEADKKACRKAFTFEQGAAFLKTSAPDIYGLAKEAYEGAIDYGAHPNVKGVAGHLSIDDERDDNYTAVTLTALYGSTHIETVRGLCACLDFGLSIIGLIALAHPEPSEQLVEDLQKLSDIKNEATDQYRPPELEEE